jgi:hypothetical protein
MYHHRLRIIASDLLDLAEQEIERAPFRKGRVERDLMERVLYLPMRKNGWVGFEHVKPEGETLKLREGEILSMESGKLILRRQFHSGRYDGLGLEIQPTDYGITEVVDGAWSLKHRYFSERGTLKGEYVNISTPIELYPDRVRYVDLHVDVVRKEGKEAKTIDQDKLDSITQKGFISRKLRDKAMEVAKAFVEK